MNKKDYIKQCIRSAAFLVAGDRDESSIRYIVNRANKMLTNVWSVEYISYDKTCPECLRQTMLDFWTNISDELEQEHAVYKCNVTLLDNGYAYLYVQTPRSVNVIRFQLTPRENIFEEA